MVIKDPLRTNTFLCRLALVVFFVIIMEASLLWAQDSGFGEEPRFVQRLSWTEDQNTLRYEIVVEKEEWGIYRNIYREFTTALSVELELPPGNYRCSVIPYDFLDRPGRQSEWTLVEVRAFIDSEPSETDESETDEEETIIAKPPRVKKKIDVTKYFSIAWMPVVPVHFTPQDQFFDELPSLIGVGARFGFVSAKQSFLNPGLEVAISFWNDFFNEASEQYITNRYKKHQDTAILNSLSLDINLVMQKYLSNRTFILSLQAGGGITLLNLIGLHTVRSNRIDDFFMWGEFRHYAQITLGVSFIWLPRGSFYLETGLDYSYLFTQDNPGYFRPRLGLGTRY